ncbi:MAG: Gfo/Idh/MocA family oxidoreductase [Kiritimatiellae bacterium]|nr:Gfo/Idh/MocA family oxidoreductase [Kiritimatiellia bacterium]MDD5519785.1 Gfo/Idh/MocA family oxidoreductase [Kiritimatiellia bacterium]
MNNHWNRRDWLKASGLTAGAWTVQAFTASAADTTVAGQSVAGKEGITANKKIRVGLYGTNGHQVSGLLVKHPDADLVAVAEFPPKSSANVKHYNTLDELLADNNVELVSLCSPRRVDQARDAVKCLRAGKHVYAEKPAALTEKELDEIIATAKQTGKQFHEMAGTIVQQPYMEMRRQIQSGAIGTVVQVLAQKCYPWHDKRPGDEAVDGGLSTQAGVYIARFVEHIAGEKITSLEMVETKLGNPMQQSECRIAVSMMIRLANGGVASGICNYLNPIKARCWGYEILRVFGTRGIIESNADGKQLRLLLNGQPPSELNPSQPTLDYFNLFIRSLCGGDPMPLSIEDELSPTRWVIRAKEKSVRS